MRDRDRARDRHRVRDRARDRHRVKDRVRARDKARDWHRVRDRVRAAFMRHSELSSRLLGFMSRCTWEIQARYRRDIGEI